MTTKLMQFTSNYLIIKLIVPNPKLIELLLITIKIIIKIGVPKMKDI